MPPRPSFAPALALPLALALAACGDPGALPQLARVAGEGGSGGASGYTNAQPSGGHAGPSAGRAGAGGGGAPASAGAAQGGASGRGGGGASQGGAAQAGAAGQGGAALAGQGGAAGQGGSAPSVTCDGAPCGTLCSPCDLADPACPPSIRFCDGAGHCTLTSPACEPCVTPASCPAAPCKVCGPSAFACPDVACEAGACVVTDTPCPTSCAPEQASGQGLCGDLLGFRFDGSACAPVVGCSCDGPACDSLSASLELCVSMHKGCVTPTSPCHGRVCGEPCSPCPAGASCEPADLHCDFFGACVEGAPACPDCMVDADCPTPPCQTCWDDQQRCPSVTCHDGACVVGEGCETPSPCAVLPVGFGAWPGCDFISFGWMWSGTACIEVISCEVGPNQIYFDETLEACTEAHKGCGPGSPCDGKACGDPCGDGLRCDYFGACVPGDPPCPSCLFNFECPATCSPCWDGSLACDPGKCSSGACEHAACPEMPPCSSLPLQLTVDPECTLKSFGFGWTGNECTEFVACDISPNGVFLSSTLASCVESYKACPAAQPCAGRPCGAPCSTCGSQGCGFEQRCDGAGSCTDLPFACISCESDLDCPPHPCDICWDLSSTCDTPVCQLGTCFEPPTCAPPPPCAVIPFGTPGWPGCTAQPFGWAWDGATCVEITGCSISPNAIWLAPSFDACIEAHSTCPPP